MPLIKPQKILIIVFQKGVKELLNRYFSIEEYPNLAFEYWYNLEGKNTYLEYTGVILFGCAGKPVKVDKILSNLLGIPLELMMNCSIQGEMNQGMLRIRPNMFPNLKWCIGLTKVLPNGIKKYINFNMPEDIILIPYLKKNPNATAKEILNDLYNNSMLLRNMQKRLAKVCNTSNIIDRRQENSQSPYNYFLI